MRYSVDFIGGGSTNTINNNSNNSFIGGGHTNAVSAAFGTLVGGCMNNVISSAPGSFIGGGMENLVYGPCSNILGGESNCMSGCYSSILGGFGNSDGGFNYAGVFGQGVTAVAANTFHVECLNAVNTPAYSGALPSGSIAYKTFGSLSAGDRVLVIQP